MSFRRVPMVLGVEQTAAPEGEHNLVVRKVESRTTKKGDPMDVLLLCFTEGNYTPFSHFITYPKPSDNEDFKAMKTREIRRLCHAYTDEGFDPEDFRGAEGVCAVTVEVYEAEGAEPRDTNRLILPRVAGRLA